MSGRFGQDSGCGLKAGRLGSKCSAEPSPGRENFRRHVMQARQRHGASLFICRESSSHFSSHVELMAWFLSRLERQVPLWGLGWAVFVALKAEALAGFAVCAPFLVHRFESRLIPTHQPDCSKVVVTAVLHEVMQLRVPPSETACWCLSCFSGM